MINQWQKSRELLERARKSLVGGVSSPFRAMFPVPLYFRDSHGAHLIDVDGNDYIDYTLAWGPNILGYKNPRVCEALAKAAMGAHTYGAQHELEPEVAEKIQAMVPCAELVAFTSSGSEAVQCALRLARAFTGRNLILKFEGHYHGWMDSTLLSYRAPVEKMGPADAPVTATQSRGQVANAADNVLVAPWNNAEFVEKLFATRGNEIAAVITEPVLVNSGCLMPGPGYLQGLRDITAKHGALLIFDEVITGFRIAPGGAQQAYGIKPDMATFGKAVAAGMPLSVVAGRADVMSQMLSGATFGGTFNGNPMVLAAANAALDELARDNGAGLRHANAMGNELMAGIGQKAAAHGVPMQIRGFGAAFGIHFTGRTELNNYRDTFDDDKAKQTAWVKSMLENGAYLLPDGRFYVSTAHTPDDVAQTIAAADRVLGSMAS
ncbi:MAG: aspartate aminotransferase family protein [Bryobacteraceae bacterium]